MVEVVCGVIGDGGGRYLACLRPAGKHLAGLWEFPGGKVEEGEEPAEALRRELLEELGVNVTVGSPLRPVEWQYEGGRIRLLPFRCGILSGDPRALEHERIWWCGREDLRRLRWAPADLPVIEEILGSELL